MVNRLLGRQLLIALGVSAVAGVFGWKVAGSALLGGAVSVACNYYFARRVLGGAARPTPHGVLAVFYWAELVKVTLAAVALSVAYAALEGSNGFALMTGFLVTHIGAAFAAGGGQVAGGCTEGRR